MSNTFLSQSDFKRTVHHTDKLRVAAYIRVSTDTDDQENSFELQKAYFEETLSRNHHWTSAGVFSDYGITGTQRKNRAGFNRMMRKCTEGKIDRILCKSISRLARNTADFIRTLDTLHDCGVSIYFEKENIDTTEAVSSFVLTALAALAQEESLSISENLKWANEKRFPAGEVPNLVIYGYRYCKGKNEYSVTKSGYKMKNIEIVPEEAEVVRHIFTEVAKGKKYVDIARELNARSIPPPEKRKGENQIGWAGRDIGNIIKSERYVGDVLIQKTVTVDALSHKSVTNNGEAPQYLIHDHHPAIIDRSLFNTVQAIRQRNSESHGNNRGSTRKDQILTGLVKCGCCGKNYNVRGRNRIPTWFCPDAEIYKGITPCRGQSVTERTIIGFIKKAFFLRFGDYNYIKLLTETLKEVQSETTLERDTDDLESKIAAAEKRIEALKIKIENQVQVMIEANSNKPPKPKKQSKPKTALFDDLFCGKTHHGEECGEKYQRHRYNARTKDYTDDRCLKSQGLSANGYEEGYFFSYAVWRCGANVKIDKKTGGGKVCPSDFLYECAMQQSFMEMIYRIKHDVEQNGEHAEIYRDFRRQSDRLSKQTDIQSNARLEEIDNRVCEIKKNIELVSTENNGSLDSIIADFQEQIKELEQEKTTLLQTMEGRNSNKETFDFFIKQVLSLPSTAPDGTKMNINTVDVEYENKSGNADLDTFGHRIETAPDYLPFDKYFYHTFIKKGIVYGDEIEYTTCFGLKLRSKGNSRTMKSFLGFRRFDGSEYHLLKYTWQVINNSVQYRRKKK